MVIFVLFANIGSICEQILLWRTEYVVPNRNTEF